MFENPIYCHKPYREWYFGLIMILSIFIPFAIIWSAFINQQYTHGILYFIFLIITSAAHRAMISLHNKSNKSDVNSMACNIIEIPFLTSNKKSTATSTYIMMYTLSYFLTGMISYDNINTNLVILLTVFLWLDIAYKLANDCNGGIGIMISLILGIFFGTITWHLTMYINKSDRNVFIQNLVNKNTCKVDVVENSCQFSDVDG